MGKTTTFSALLMLLVACDVTTSDASASRSSQGDRNHIIRPGETLYSIAHQAYGDGLEWPTLQAANPWCDPDRLIVGDRIRIPPLKHKGGNFLSVDPNNAEYARDREDLKDPEEEAKAKKPAWGGLTTVFRNIVKPGGGGKLFGQPVHTLSFMALAVFFGHAFFQGFLLWIIATLTFVKEATLSKALKATFHTEIITLFSVIVLGGVALLMIHIGTTAPGVGNSPDIFNTMETYLQHPVGLTVAGLFVMSMYVLLSMRFIPQAFGLQRAQSLVLVFFGILLPHLMAIYTVGQRYGFIQM